VIAGGLGRFHAGAGDSDLGVKDNRRWLRWFGVIAVLGGSGCRRCWAAKWSGNCWQYWLPVMHAVFAQIVFAAVLGIAVFTSKWWVSERPQLVDSGAPSIQTLAIVNATVIFLQVVLGAGFRHRKFRCGRTWSGRSLLWPR